MFVKLALDENGHVKVTEDGKPLYINDKEEEVPVDPPAMYQKIVDLGVENKKFREQAEGLATKYKALESEEDFDKWFENATKAIEQVANFNDKDWMDAKKVESLKEQMKDAHKNELGQIKEQFETTIGDQKAELEKKDQQIRKLVVSNKFANSPLFSGAKPKTTMSADIAESFFGHHFQVEDNERTGSPEVKCYFDNGDIIVSASPDRIGEHATFDEGIEILFNNYANKDMYLPSKSGSGAKGGSGDDEPTTDMAKLQQDYNEAADAKNTQLMISIKNRMTQLQQTGKAA